MPQVADSLNTGLHHHRAGDLAMARECYEQALLQSPEHPDALHLLGVTELQRGNHDAAIAHLADAVRLQPESPEFHNNLAAAYRGAGRLAEAAEGYRHAISISPRYADAHNNLGNVLREQGHLEAAQDCYRRALELNPESTAARENLAVAEREDGRQSPEAVRVTVSQPAPSAAAPVAENPQTAADPDLKTVLHVGCGPADPARLHERFRDGQWRELRLDIDPRVAPDVVASLTDMSAIDSGSVDAVWSSHNLEHLRSHEVPLALAEFLRVLKPGGFALVTMPDLQQIAALVADDKLEETAYISPAGPITPLDVLYGLRTAVANGNDFMAHRTGFTATTLNKHLRAAGFDPVTISKSPLALWGEAVKPH